MVSWCQLFFFFPRRLNVPAGSGAEGAALPGHSVHSNTSQSHVASAAARPGQHTHSALLLSKQVSILTPTDTGVKLYTST